MNVATAGCCHHGVPWACDCPMCGRNGSQQTLTPVLSIPSPRVMPVNLPFPFSGSFTVAVMDSSGNVTIKTDHFPNPFE
jgi:hypothetical protein